MVVIPVRCPSCERDTVVKRGKTDSGKQRYRCQNAACFCRTFLLDYTNRGYIPSVKRQIIDLTMNGSGIRDTARVLRISTDTGSAIQVRLSEYSCYSRPDPQTDRGKAKGSTMIKRETCPQCGSRHEKRNGRIHTGTQNHKGKACGRAFVLVPENRVITEEQRAVIERLLLERISLRGICRVIGGGLRWLLHFMVERFTAAPDELYIRPTAGTQRGILQRLEAEVDELWSFVGRKANRQWVWIAMEARTRQLIAFHVGDRSRQSAQALWEKIPAGYQAQALFYTDQYEVYKGVIPSAQHRAITKLARKTNHVERFNCTLRQRVSRLVRATLSFSKNLTNHIGAIKYFICDYNLTRGAALPG